MLVKGEGCAVGGGGRCCWRGSGGEELYWLRGRTVLLEGKDGVGGGEGQCWRRGRAGLVEGEGLCWWRERAELVEGEGCAV